MLDRDENVVRMKVGIYIHHIYIESISTEHTERSFLLFFLFFSLVRTRVGSLG